MFNEEKNVERGGKIKDRPLPPGAFLLFLTFGAVAVSPSTCAVAGIPQRRQTGAELTPNGK